MVAWIHEIEITAQKQISARTARRGPAARARVAGAARGLKMRAELAEVYAKSNAFSVRKQ